jgi:hypothetical protein
MNITQITGVLILSVALHACQKETIRGTGNNISQERTLESFSYLQTNGDIKVHISQGSSQRVEVKGYENLVGITETKVQNNKLTVKYKEAYTNVKNSNIELFIIVPKLEDVGTNGSGDIWIDGFNSGISLDASINGSSNINITQCQYDQVYFDVNGSGDIKAYGLLSKKNDAIIHGSGDIETSCSERLKARIYGSGDIRYRGDPALDVQVSGSGTVSKQ